MRNTPFHKIIPERISILNKLNTLLNPKVHFTIKYAKRSLPFTSKIINPNNKQTIMITAGCHGNEPAPIYALYNVLKKLKTKYKIILVPCINPYGFSLHQAENENKININRDFKKFSQKQTKILKQLTKLHNPIYVINMHEDPDESKFFIYVEGNIEHLAKKLINRVHLPHYKNKRIHKDTCINGIIKKSVIKTTFEGYLTSINIPNLCIETPGLLPLKERVKAYETVIKNVI